MFVVVDVDAIDVVVGYLFVCLFVCVFVVMVLLLLLLLLFHKTLRGYPRKGYPLGQILLLFSSIFLASLAKIPALLRI